VSGNSKIASNLPEGCVLCGTSVATVCVVCYQRLKVRLAERDAKVERLRATVAELHARLAAPAVQAAQQEGSHRE
jgi:hypothetical protein